MALLPVSYNLRSLFVRRAATILTILSIAATVAVLAGVLSLQQGFTTLFAQSGREDIAIMIRPGAGSEAESYLSVSEAEILMKSVPEIAEDAAGQPLAAAECYLAVRLFKVGGGETNVPIRGVQPASLKIHGERLRISAGELFRPGRDEVIVGRALVDRIQGCQLHSSIQLNTIPFKVVGLFDLPGPYASEIWGDLDRIGRALNLEGSGGQPVANRILAQMRPGADIPALARRLEQHKEVPVKVQSERAYLAGQTGPISTVLIFLGTFLAILMGIAAVFTGTNTMLAALSARTHEIGVLLALGFRPVAVFCSFLMEALTLGLLGGLVGCLIALPLNGIQTGTTNWSTFTEVAFAFRVTPMVMVSAVLFAVLLGLLGGLWPAWRAAHLEPTGALRGE